MMRSGFTTGLGATLFAVCLAVFVTWPQALHMGTSIFSHHDPYFSIWRISWVAHALVTSPSMCSTQIFLSSDRHARVFGCDAPRGTWRLSLDARVARARLQRAVPADHGSASRCCSCSRHVTGAYRSGAGCPAFTMALPRRARSELQGDVRLFISATERIDDRSWRSGILAGLGFQLRCYPRNTRRASPFCSSLRSASFPSGRRHRGFRSCMARWSRWCSLLTCGLTTASCCRWRCGQIVVTAPDQLSVGNVICGDGLRSMGGRRATLPGAGCSLLSLFSATVPEMDVPLRGDRVLAAISFFGTNGTPIGLSDHMARCHGFRSASRFAMLAMCAIGIGGTRHAGDGRCAAARAPCPADSALLLVTRTGRCRQSEDLERRISTKSFDPVVPAWSWSCRWPLRIDCRAGMSLMRSGRSHIGIRW